MIACALSTADNPFNPLTDFENWFRYDTDKGYNTCGVLARFTETSDQFTDAENAYEIERAIDKIVSTDPLNRFVKVKQEVKED